MCPGRGFIVEHWRGEERLDDLVNVESYAYDSPTSYEWVSFYFLYCFLLFGYLKEHRKRERERDGERARKRFVCVCLIYTLCECKGVCHAHLLLYICLQIGCQT